MDRSSRPEHEKSEFDPVVDSSRDVASAFRREWASSRNPSTASPELLPVRLAQACVAVLPVDGAGLSLHQTHLRVPVGASDEVATLAERLQFTHGEGPCIESAASRRLLVADSEELEARWPSFTDELFRHTAYRAIVSVPLAITRTSFGALDLYLVGSAALGSLSLLEVSAVSGQLMDALTSALAQTLAADPGGPITDSDPADVLLPMWLHSAPAEARTYVWIAMGILMTQFHLSAVDALALLRSHAYAHESLLDDVAASIVAGRINLAEMAP